MIYKIDTESVDASVGDWRAQYRPASKRAKEESFPGIARRFFVSPPAEAPDLVVRGFLRATGADGDAAADALRVLERTYMAMRSDGILHAVQVGNTTHAEAKLMDFNTEGDRERADVGVTLYMKIAVSFSWRFTTSEVTTV